MELVCCLTVNCQTPSPYMDGCRSEVGGGALLSHAYSLQDWSMRSGPPRCSIHLTCNTRTLRDRLGQLEQGRHSSSLDVVQCSHSIQIWRCTPSSRLPQYDPQPDSPTLLVTTLPRHVWCIARCLAGDCRGFIILEKGKSSLFLRHHPTASTW